MRATITSLLAPAALLALAAGCGPAADTASDVEVELAFDPAPRVGTSTCTVRLADLAGDPLAGADLELEGNMNHAGMVPVFANPIEASPGVYEAELEFTMGGDWFVVVRGTLADGRALEHVHDLPGVPTGEGEAECCTEDGEGAASQ